MLEGGEVEVDNDLGRGRFEELSAKETSGTNMVNAGKGCEGQSR